MTGVFLPLSANSAEEELIEKFENVLEVVERNYIENVQYSELVDMAIVGMTADLEEDSAFIASALFSNEGAALGTDYRALQRFSQVLDMVDQYYFEETTQSELIDGAIKGMLESLDPHSTYMTAEEFETMQESTSGEFFGIGAELSIENGQPIVIAPIEGTPAFRAGIQAGDVIISVDGEPTLDRQLTDVVAEIRGPKGTEVTLVVLPAGEMQTRVVTLVRDIIPYISVRSEELEPGYLWLRLALFNERTTSELEEELESYQAENELKGIILDMRNNPGGILNEAVSVSDLFLESGTIVSIRGRENSLARRYSASDDLDDILDVPMIVLINPGSASASEIVAGALRDNDRALLMGETSFGKGSVQNLIPFSDGSGIKITIALYYTPSGESIQAYGIIPHMEVPLLIEGETIDSELIVREADLEEHLDSTDEALHIAEQIPVPEILPLSENLSEENREILEQDNQLRMALQVIQDMPEF